MIYIALSCLQGRTQQSAYDELSLLNPDGIQLTPGNKVSPNLKENIKLPYRLHHSFSWTHLKRRIYDDNNIPIDIQYNQSIHPPQIGDFDSWIEKIGDYILEVMYPGYLLGNGKEIEKAINLNKRLAVDISHLFILESQKVIEKSTISKLLDYHNIAEIHISQNAGIYDSHKPIDKNTPYLDWVKSRKDVPLVYESYLHKLNFEERIRQIDLIRK